MKLLCYTAVVDSDGRAVILSGEFLLLHPIFYRPHTTCALQFTTPTTTRTWKTTWLKRIRTRRTSAGRADGRRHWRNIISTPTSTNTLADRDDNNNIIRAAVAVALRVVGAYTTVRFDLNLHSDSSPNGGLIWIPCIPTATTPPLLINISYRVTPYIIHNIKCIMINYIYIYNDYLYTSFLITHIYIFF